MSVRKKNDYLQLRNIVMNCFVRTFWKVQRSLIHFTTFTLGLQFAIVSALLIAAVFAEPPAPRSSYLPPQARGSSAPSSQYGAPSQGRSNFGASAPRTNYGAPAQQQPRNQYGPPQVSRV